MFCYASLYSVVYQSLENEAPELGQGFPETATCQGTGKHHFNPQVFAPMSLYTARTDYPTEEKNLTINWKVGATFQGFEAWWEWEF